MRPLISLLTAAALLVVPTIPVQAQTQSGITEVVVHARKLDWSDLTEVVIRAKVPGPAMWKLTRGNSTIWVLGVLEEAPLDLKWDDRRLKRTLDGARYLIAPGEARYNEDNEKTYHRASMLPPVQSLKDVVSSTTYLRFQQTVDSQGGLTVDKYAHYIPERAGAEMYEDVLLHSGIGTDVDQVPQVKAMAGTGTEIRDAFRFDGDMTGRELLRLTPAQNEACLNAYLDAVDFDRDTLPRMAHAWASGDLPTVLHLYQDSPALTCDLMTPDWAAYEQTAMTDMTRTIEETLKKPGKSVAVMTISQLLRKGGVLDQLHADGVDVTSPPI